MEEKEKNKNRVKPMESNRPNNQQRGNKGGIHKSSQLPTASHLFSIRDNSNELITRFPSTKAENQKKQSKRWRKAHSLHERGSWQSFSKIEVEKLNNFKNSKKKKK